MSSLDSFARYACLSCRKGKRKCTRELPTCGLCRRSRRPCAYTAETSPDIVGEGPEAPPSHKSLQPLFFLDAYTFAQRRVAIENPKVALPREFADILDNENETYILEIAESYFDSVHTFFPIVSKRHLHQSLAAPDSRTDVDLLALIMCMKLLVDPKVEHAIPAASPQYDRTKRCIQFVEGQGIISIRVVQANLLLSFYEMANAIYPAAFLTVAHSARLGQAIGMHDRRNAPQMFPTPISWTRVEETRRVWWGVIIMDRFVKLGIESRPFASDDARPEDLLPINEDSWESGEQSVTPSLAVSADTNLQAPPFARTCQAAHLLSRVLTHINSNNTTPNRREYYTHSMQLHHVVRAFHLVLKQEMAADDNNAFSAASSALALCHSAMLALYDAHTCADVDDPAGVGIPEQLSMQEISLSGMFSVLVSVCEFASMLKALWEVQPDRLLASPFVAQSLYVSALQYIWYIRETDKKELLSYVHVLTDMLRLLGQRWHVANEYLAILEAEPR